MKNFNEQLFSSMGRPAKPVRRSIKQPNKQNSNINEQWEKKNQASISTNASSMNSLYCSLGKNKLKQLDEYDIFKCLNCQLKSDPNCQICGGKIELSGKSNIVKFMEYVLQFKLGYKDSYVSQKQKNKNQDQPNAWCIDVISSSNIRSTNIQSLKISQSASNIKLYQSTMLNKCKQAADVHNGYQCDICKSYPIKGPRHHCKLCQDYDLCQQCYNSQGHQHEMTKIQGSLLYSSISGVLQKLNKQKNIQELKGRVHKQKMDNELLRSIGVPSIYKSSIR